MLDYITFQQLMNACLVSRGWMLFIRSAPGLWWHIDLTHARKKVKDAFISRAINVGRAKITKITLNKLPDCDKALSALIRHGTIEEVTLLTTGLLRDNLADTLACAPSLKSLHISEAIAMTVTTVPRITCQTSKTLESLRWDDVSSRTDGLYMGIHPPLACPVLKRLDLSWSNTWGALSEFLSSIASLPNLEYLRLGQLEYNLHVGPLVLDLNNHNALQHLDLSLSFSRDDLLTLPTSLKYLALRSRGSRSASSWIHTNLNAFLPALEHLHLDVVRMPVPDYNCLLRDSSNWPVSRII